MRWNDLRLLPGAAAIWSLAAIGILLGAQAAIAACAVLCSSVLAANVVIPRRATTHILFAHLAVVALAGVLLFPVLLRHDETSRALHTAAEEGLVVQLAVTARADPAAPSSGPEWSRSGLQMMARTIPARARIGAEEVSVPASVPVLVRSSGEEATTGSGIG